MKGTGGKSHKIIIVKSLGLQYVKFQFLLPLLLLLLSNNAFCQRLIKGHIYPDNEMLYPGVLYIIDGSNLSNFTISINGRDYALEISDTTEYIIISDEIPSSSLYRSSNNEINQKIELADKNEIDFELLIEKNSIDSIPVVRKNRTANDNLFKYKIQYNRKDTLTKVRLESLNAPKTTYKYDLEYFDSYIKADFSIYNKEKKDFFHISSVKFHFDFNGAIRERTVRVEYGSYHDFERTIYYYGSDKIYKTEVFLTENLSNDYHNVYNLDKSDMITKIIQNEIFRKAYYKSGFKEIFRFDYRIVPK